jgi:hypothetical protein
MPRLLAMALLLTACAVTPPPARQPTPIPFVPQPLALAGDCPTLCIRRLSSSALPRWRMLELDLETPIQSSNSFDPQQIDLAVRFTAPSGQTFDVPAFFYRRADAQGWKARFTPSEEGRWRARAIMRAPLRFEGEAAPVTSI